jgi:protein TonB
MTSALSQSQLLFAPKPDYPKLALASRTEGVVRLQAIIGRDGTIQNLHVLDGSPLLTQAAIEAVQRWHYRPMLLNGEPVEVITEVDVHFTLQR